MKLLEHTLLKILQDEDKMEKYLQQFGDKPSSIDPIIWQVHFSAPVNKRMTVLKRYFQQLFKKYSLVFTFLPDHIILAKVYKILNIPYYVNSSKTSSVDVVSCRKLPKTARFNRYARIYNSVRQTKKIFDLGIFEYNEECPGPFIPYTEFRKECMSKKSDTFSALDVLNQLSKDTTKKKIVSNFALDDAHFSTKHLSLQNNSRVKCDVDPFLLSETQTRANPEETECNQPKKKTLSNERGYKIFKSKYPPRLNVQLKGRNLDSANSTTSTDGNKIDSSESGRKLGLSREKSYPNFYEIPDSTKSCNPFTFSKNKDQAVLVNRINALNCLKLKEIQIEADVVVEQTAVEQNMSKGGCTSNEVVTRGETNLRKLSEEVSSQPFSKKSVFVVEPSPVDENAVRRCSNESVSVVEPSPVDENAVQLCSEESVSVVKPTPVYENPHGYDSSEPEVVYSGNRSKDTVASEEFSTRDSISPRVTFDQLQYIHEENNFATFFNNSGVNFTASPACENSSQSNSSCNHTGSNDQPNATLDGPVTGDFDQLYERTPLKIVRRKNLKSLKDAENSENNAAVFDHLLEENENNRSRFEMWHPDAENEKNQVSDSETSIVSSKASPLLADSVIYTQRSSESESEETDQTNCFAALPLTDSQKFKAITDTNDLNSIRERRVSEIDSSSQQKSRSQSKYFMPEQPVSEPVAASREKLRTLSKNPKKKTMSLDSTKRSNKLKATIDKKKVKKLTDFVTFSIRKHRASNFELSESDDQTAALRIKEAHVVYESTPRSRTVRSASPKIQPGASRQIRKVKKLFSESEESFLPSPIQEKSSTKVDLNGKECESPSSSRNTAPAEIEKNSDSDSSSSYLSREFKTLSLASKKSCILFPSQSSKMSPSSTSVNMLNSSVSAEITLDQIDQMMKGVVPNEFPETSFNCDLTSQFSFKYSSTAENFEDKLTTSNFSQISSSSSSPMENTLIAEEFPSNYSALNLDKEDVPRRYLSNFASQDTLSPAADSTVHQNSSSYSLEFSFNEDIKTRFSLIKFSDSSVFPYSTKESPLAEKKLKKFSPLNFNESLSTRRHCLSLPTKNESVAEKCKRKRKPANVSNDDTSDDDIFRDSLCRSLPVQLKKKSSSFCAQQVRRGKLGHGDSLIKGRSQQKMGDFHKSPLSVTEKLCHFSNREQNKLSVKSEKLRKFELISDDDYESDELNSALDDNLTQFNNWKENKDMPDEDAKSTTSHHYDDEIAQLLNEYAALNAEQQPLSLSSNLPISESTSFMSTLPVESNSQVSNLVGKNLVISSVSNYKNILWNSYPDSLETALTTPEEKLEEVRNTMRDKFINSGSQKLFTSSQKSKSSRENESDSFSVLDWD